MDRYELYECCVQSPKLLVPLLRAIHAGGGPSLGEIDSDIVRKGPTVLGEDFCGSAALSRAWVGMVPGGRAIGVDFDPEPLARAAAQRALQPGVTLIESDVTQHGAKKLGMADIVFVGNFSIGEIHDRPNLVEYMRNVRARLNEGGVFVCDTYGGEHAFTIGDIDREHEGLHGEKILYRWEQREADPLTGRVVNALHFRVVVDGEVVQDIDDAFVYDWRLWSVPELRNAMQEADFVRTDVYPELPDAVDDEGEAYAMPIEDASELGEDFIVYVAGRVGT